jgi:hypothetical protein
VQSLQCTFDTPEGGNVLHVFIEPAYWNKGVDGKRPIVLLNVTTESYLGTTPVSGIRAVSDTENSCKDFCLGSCWHDIQLTRLTGTLHWKISTSSSSTDEIRQQLFQTKERQFRALNVPNGVSLEDMPKWMQALKFNGHEKDRRLKFKKTWFTMPNPHISKLRTLARAGRDEIASLASFPDDKTNHVWDEHDSIAEITDGFLGVSGKGRTVTEVGEKSDQEMGWSLPNPPLEDCNGQLDLPTT